MRPSEEIYKPKKQLVNNNMKNTLNMNCELMFMHDQLSNCFK